MPALRILAKNILDAANVSSVVFGAAVAGYPVSNALTARRSDTARVSAGFAGPGVYSGAFNFQIPVAANCNCAVLARTNVASTGGYTSFELRRAGAALSITNIFPLFGDSDLDLLTDTSSLGLNNHVIWLGNTFSVDQIYFSLLTSTPSGVMQCGRVFAGVYKQLTLNFDWENSVEWVDLGSSTATYGGDLIASYNGPLRRKITLPFNGIPEADRAYLFDMMRVVGTTGELFISMWPGAGGRLERDHQMWCRIANTDALRQSHVDFYGTSITFIEC